MSSCDFKCFVVGYGYVQRSEQFALFVLCSVQCNVSSVRFMSVGFSVHSVQCQSIASAQLYGVQCKVVFRVYSISSV